uniref:uncharacterized protein LOC120339254 n=1 Tax=Styela clava TaxID=7725 RepID=UPI00193ADF71|nr:uncharacterized protein LOC120339254 [Styela clava]
MDMSQKSTMHVHAPNSSNAYPTAQVVTPIVREISYQQSRLVYAERNKKTFLLLAEAQLFLGLSVIGIGIASIMTSSEIAKYDGGNADITGAMIAISAIGGILVVIYPIFGMIQYCCTTKCTIITNIVMSVFGILDTFGGAVRAFSISLSSMNDPMIPLFLTVTYLLLFLLFICTCVMGSKAVGCCTCCGDQEATPLTFVPSGRQPPTNISGKVPQHTLA